MKTQWLVLLGMLVSLSAAAQSRFSTHELSVNAFRNPSIGAEYRYKRVSVHAGYYPTILNDNATTDAGATNNTTSFVRAGLTYWFLPVGQRRNPSSFYASASYVRGLDYEYTDRNGVMGEVGFRWMVVSGLNLRIGVAALKAPGRNLQINPTPGISYSFFFR